MTRATAAYALRCPGQCSEEKDAFGSFPAILVCNVRPPGKWKFLAVKIRLLKHSTA